MEFIDLNQTNTFLTSKNLPTINTEEYGLYTEQMQKSTGEIYFVTFIPKMDFIKKTDQPIKFFREMFSEVTTLVLNEDPFEC